jgi:CRP/FNR family transcriptional regulator
MSKLTVDLAAALEAIPYVRVLRREDRAALAASSIVKPLAKGERAFEEGSAPVGVFLILSGRIRLVRPSAGGREQMLHEEGPGVTLGEVAVFDGGGYVASAVAAEDSSLLFIPRTPLLACIARSSESALEVIQILACRVRTFAMLVEDLSLRTVAERTARYLLRESQRTGVVTIVLPDTRDVLAARIGTVREQVSRALSQFTREGIIELHGRDLRIVDPRGLKRLAGT